LKLLTALLLLTSYRTHDELAV